VGIEARVAQVFGDALHEPLRDSVFQPLGLDVHLVPAKAQGLDQKQLEQPVIAHDLQGDALPGGRQPDAAVRLVLDQVGARQLLRHFGRRGSGNFQRIRQHGSLHAVVFLLKQIDRLEKILNRLAVDLGLVGHRHLAGYIAASHFHCNRLSRPEQTKSRLANRRLGVSDLRAGSQARPSARAMVAVVSVIAKPSSRGSSVATAVHFLLRVSL